MANSKTIDAISKGPYQWGIVPDDEHQKEWLDKHFGFGSGPVHLIGLPQHPKSVVGSDPERPEHMVTLCMTGNGPNSEANCKAIIALLVQRDAAKQIKEAVTLPIPTTPDAVAWAEYAITLENALGISDAVTAPKGRS